jgi:hypothetical protein
VKCTDLIRTRESAVGSELGSGSGGGRMENVAYLSRVYISLYDVVNKESQLLSTALEMWSSPPRPMARHRVFGQNAIAYTGAVTEVRTACPFISDLVSMPRTCTQFPNP